MNLCISSAHGKFVRGARGIIDEVDESRKVTNRVAELLRVNGHVVTVFHDDVSKSVSTNLSAIVGFHNRQTRDRDVSVHFNAFQRTTAPRGTEVCFLTQQALAANISKAMADAGGFINRGGKKRSNLSFLNRTAKPAVLLEVCFVDSTVDVDLYRSNYDRICKAISDSIVS